MTVNKYPNPTVNVFDFFGIKVFRKTGKAASVVEVSDW
jgi:hypothetical protein